MSDELVFYTNPMSRGRMVRWMLEEVGRPYRTEVIEWGQNRAPGFLAVNPMGKVPAIVHRGRTVTECPAICAYLADAFPDAGLAPPPAERADYYRWLFFAAGPFEAALTDKALGVTVAPKQEGMVGYGQLDRVLDTLEGMLDGRDYIAGDRFTAADLYLGSQLAFQMLFKTVEPRPAFSAYVDRLHQRPAFARATELDGAMPAA